MAKKSTRGSDKLFAGLAASDANALRSATSGWKIIDWHQLGKPDPEIITGALTGSPSRVGSVVGKLVKVKEIRDIEILINGTPRPDLAQVRFEMRTTGRR